MDILLQENLVGPKPAPTAISRTVPPLESGNQVSLLRIFFSHPEADGKSTDGGGWGVELGFWKREELLGEGQKGTPQRGREEKRQKMSWQIGPEAPPPSHSCPLRKRKGGKLVREVRGSKDKTNGRERDALSWHFLSRPLPSVPFWPSPSFLDPAKGQIWNTAEASGPERKYQPLGPSCCLLSTMEGGRVPKPSQKRMHSEKVSKGFFEASFPSKPHRAKRKPA